MIQPRHPHHYHPHHLVKTAQTHDEAPDPIAHDERNPRPSSVEFYRLTSSPDAQESGRPILHVAAAKGHVDAVKAALQAGADVNAVDSSCYTALHQAATEGNTDVVRLLLKNGAHVDAQDEIHGSTALHEAAWKGYSQTLEALCKHKANVYIRNKGGFTALHLACQNGHNQSCRVLLLAGCKPDVKNNYGDTPLHTAARYGHAGVLRILISAFCHVSEVNKNGDTALHIAAAMGRRKLTKILLESGCNVDIKNKQGETARDIATRKGFSEVVALLEQPPSKAAHQKASRSDKNKPKKRDKDSGTSQGSKENASRHSRDKHKKSKHKHQVHFPDGDFGKGAEQQGVNGHFSPYGCHMFPNVAAFPAPKLDSLPVDPLHKGEQYYIDLAGNIKKGPVGVGYACYCAPFFHHVERKLEADKQDLMDHIDHAHEDLNAKIADLERRTRNRLFHLNQNVKQKLAEEKEECLGHQERRAQRERLEMDDLRAEMKSWVHSIFGKNEAKRQSSIRTNKSGASALRKSKSHGERINLVRSSSVDSLSDGDDEEESGLAHCEGRNRAPLHVADVHYVHRLQTDFEKLGARPKNDIQVGQQRQSDPTTNGHHRHAQDVGLFLQMRRDSRSEGDLTACHRYDAGSRHPYVEPYPGCEQDSLEGSPCDAPLPHLQHTPTTAAYLSSSHHPGPPPNDQVATTCIGLPLPPRPSIEEGVHHAGLGLPESESLSPGSPSQGGDSGIETMHVTQRASINSSDNFAVPAAGHPSGASLV